MLFHRAAVLLLALALPAPCATWLVSKAGDGTNGLTWETSFQEIGPAVLASTTGDEIWVAGGTYFENLVVTIPLTILGGFAGNETVGQRDSRSPEQYPSVIDGNHQRTVITIRSEVILDGFTITNGLSFGGSGVNISDASLTLSNCKITLNGKRGQSDRGGGIHAIRSTLHIESCQISNNVANRLGGGIGGGLGMLESHTVVSNSTFIGNNSGDLGAGIAATLSHYTIDRCLFERNVTDPGPQPMIVVTEGGAIFSQYSKGTVSNSVFVQNQSLNGSIVCLKDTEPGEVVFSNCTAEIDTDYGGSYGIGWDVSPRFINCILTSERNPNFFFEDTGDISYSLIQGGYPGEGNIEGDPKFVDPAYGDYHLLRSSPCIDSGTDTGLDHDFDGNFRPIGDFDMGAFEFPFLRSDINGSGKVDSTDLLILQEDWKKVSGP